MKTTYIALVEQAPNGSYDISFPDLPGTHAQAMSLAQVQEEATNALCSFLLAAFAVGMEVAPPSAAIRITDGQMAVIVNADTEAYARANDAEPVRKTVSIPSWMAKGAQTRGISLSKALQDALRSRLTE